MASEHPEIVIAVMGPTGVGKSSFIRLVTGRDDVTVGDRLVSETNKVTLYKLHVGTKTLGLVDTPGFDDTYISDRDVLRTLSRWLEHSYNDGQLLTGILYLHRISDPRMQGSALRNLYMFKKLCGKDAMPNIVLGTTFWDTTQENPTLAERREKELIESEDMWGAMISRGSKAVRITNNQVDMIDLLVTAFDCAPRPLIIQRELVDEGKFIDDTDAGKILVELKMLVKEHEEKLRIASMARDRDIALQRYRHEQELAEKQREWEQRLRQEDEARTQKETTANEALQELQQRLQRLETTNLSLNERLRRQSTNRICLTSPEVKPERIDFRPSNASFTRDNIKQSIEYHLFLLGQERSKGMIAFASKPFSSGNTRFCDVCFCTIGAATYHTCPSCYNDDFNICRFCYDSGATCGIDDHIPSYTRRREMNNRLYCPRMASPPNNTPLSCHKCRKDVGFCYFHCCNCSSDSFDLCFECALRGRKCLKWASSGGHPMSMYFRPALLLAGSSGRASSISGISSPHSDGQLSPIFKTATWGGQTFGNSSMGPQSPRSAQDASQIHGNIENAGDDKQMLFSGLPAYFPAPPPLPKRT